MTRAGGLALVKVLSKELAKENILVNAVLLGLVQSEQWRRRWQESAGEKSLDDFYADLGKTIPLEGKHQARAAEISASLRFCGATSA